MSFDAYTHSNGAFWTGNPDDNSFYAVPCEDYWHFDLENVMPFNPLNKKKKK